MKALDYWTYTKGESGDNPIVRPSDFNISLAVFTRKDTHEVARKVESGELGELLRLTMRLQDLCATPKEDREAPTKELVEWLKKLPDIKRQAVTNAARVPIRGCLPLETAKELQSIAEVDY